MKKGKWDTWKRIELSNSKSISFLEEKENFKYPGILEVDMIKQTDMKKKSKKRIPQKNQKTSRSQTLQ